MLQIARVFFRSQPTPNPSQEGTQEGKSGGPSQNELLQYQFLGHKLSFSLGALPGTTGVVAGSHRSLGRLEMAQVS
ncbi:MULTISPECIES: hypothetical protein [Okeania]|uniref:Uncharacterized protein n=1 Tax=Okeania hirsuta TaxID=1458930 RepID=A0A3N6NJW5_9CYAN|nr:MULTISPECIES: hypothetical protein [Okeania]NET11542.1 hypothetical protein [Okeania sp. SIO1H6]NES75932.1 hypothetical protein [Okeania sp. SIO1H4]NES89791.1 hypothetical protein [Okeania sp. SIO2B9]NET18893.1 hypothetical protein [Okeania sp. SIO1H5]NET76389.1 hypothetical protein [Okeania sp. SIO1F9]